MHPKASLPFQKKNTVNITHKIEKEQSVLPPAPNRKKKVDVKKKNNTQHKKKMQENDRKRERE